MTQSRGLHHTFSAPHLILRGITRHIEHLHFVDADKAGVVGELRVGRTLAMAEPVYDEGVAVGSCGK